MSHNHRPLAADILPVDSRYDKQHISTTSLDKIRSHILEKVDGHRRIQLKPPEQANPPAPHYGDDEALKIPVPGYNKHNVTVRVVDNQNRKELIVSDLRTTKCIKRIDITYNFARIDFNNATFVDGMMTFPYNSQNNEGFKVHFK